ncbi:tropomyosin [Russula aff. rugulosa BPL654]|nr:tropomyosin [Russula aff. rugulosa BPL654]
MEKIREKLAALRAEADASVERAEAAEAKNKELEQALLGKDQEIISLNHRLNVTDGSLHDSEETLAKTKSALEEAEHGKATNDSLNRKVELLEDELDTAEKNLKETVDKLRQVDIKAEHFERQVQRVEQERDDWIRRYEEMEAKHSKAKAELDELVANMEGL